jgi:hypothetical protein
MASVAAAVMGPLQLHTGNRSFAEATGNANHFGRAQHQR